MSAVIRPDPRPVRLGDIVDALSTRGEMSPASATDLQILGVTLDSRSVRPGDLYAALPGHQTHGARFVRQALAAGAVAVLTDPAGANELSGVDIPVVTVEDPRARLGQVSAQVYGFPARALQLLGVTGTNGKTTVASMVESGL
jgi:UDP-N-acetylmuramoyl-L-alanyl-D-glutamate--2,6-diaminopimelate ligase